MKTAIVVGHNARAQGAVRVTDGRTEFDWNSELAEMIRDHDKRNIRIFYRTPGGGYSAEIDRVYAEVDKWGANVSIELHFNGALSPEATGCLMLSSGSLKSMRLAAALGKRCSALLGNPDRGIKKVTRHDRGGRSLWQGKAPAVLTEPYFGSNPTECKRASVWMDQLAEAHYRAVYRDYA